MHTELLIAIAMILGLGMLSQWLAWRVRVPSILFLLLVGLGVGPISESIMGSPLLDVDAFLGDLLFPVVSGSVALILFEGGLGLRFSEIKTTSGIVGKLVTLGVGLTWLISAGAAYFLFNLSVGLSLLLGATVVVTGPTVIVPLLRQIRPQGRVGSILRWEGIIIDPIGAILAVLIFEELLIHASFLGAIWALTKTILIGAIIGWVVAQMMIELYRRFLVPDHLQKPVTVAFVLAAFTASNLLQAESGLLTVTIMGIIMANQNRLNIRPLVEFNETLQVLLLSSLFIILSARMQPSDLQQFGWETLAFVAVIILVERPLAVWLATLGSDLNWKERLFISSMAPRGIVAAAVASIFAQELAAQGYPDADRLVPFTFSVIIGTVAFYSFFSGFMARRLGLAEQDPQGLVIVGATGWIRAVTGEIQKAGFRVLLTDTNQANVQQAERDGLDIYHGNILSEVAGDELNFGGIGRLLAMTPNNEVNTLVTRQYQHTFGSEATYQLQLPGRPDDREGISSLIGGRPLLPGGFTHEDIAERFQSGAEVMTITIDEPEQIHACISQAVLPFFVMPDDETLNIWAKDDPPAIKSGYRMIAMMQPDHCDSLLEQGAIHAVRDDADSQQSDNPSEAEDAPTNA